MKIGIIGAGSIGLLFASYLSDVFSVTLYTRTEDQARNILDAGITLLRNNDQQTKRIRALSFEKWKGEEDLTIIAVKQYQLEPVLEKINNIQDINKNLLFLQNGMGHLKLLSKVNAKNVFVGTVEHGASKENNLTVRHNGEGAVNIAVYKGNSGILSKFALMSPEIFPIILMEDYYEMLIKKLMVNAVVNPLTAILQVKNGELVSNPFYFHTLGNVYSEIASILNVKNPTVYLEKIIRICQNTANNRSSMLSDLEAGRKTEIDAILGYIVEEAERQEKTAPLITNLFYLVKGKENVREET